MAFVTADYLDDQIEAIEGLKVDGGSDQFTATFVDPTNASLFGRAAIRGANANEFQVPTGSTGIFIGITLHTFSVEASLVPLVTEGVPAEQPMKILQKGRVWVVAEEAISLGDAVWFRFTSPSETFEALGRFRTDIDTANAKQVINAKWITEGAAGALVQLELFHTVG